MTKTCQLPWNVLQAGFRVVMKDGYPWTVKAHDLTSITVERDGRPPVTRPLPTGDAEVVLDVRTQAVLDKRVAEAEAVLGTILGAEREAIGNPGAYVHVLPTQWWNEEDLRMHLRFMHGEYEYDVKTVDGEFGLLALHAHGHEMKDTPRYVPHVHHDKTKE
jgi:hypothetical protein